MDRQKFLTTCGIGCLGVLSGSMLLSACSSASVMQVALNDNQFVIPKDAFVQKEQEGVSSYFRYLIVQPEGLKYQVVVYRANADEFRALLLRCTHKGTALNVYGDLISCPSHGSEFNKLGEVLEGPAAESLRSFSVLVNNQDLVVTIS